MTKLVISILQNPNGFGWNRFSFPFHESPLVWVQTKKAKRQEEEWKEMLPKETTKKNKHVQIIYRLAKQVTHTGYHHQEENWPYKVPLESSQECTLPWIPVSSVWPLKIQ